MVRSLKRSVIPLPQPTSHISPAGPAFLAVSQQQSLLPSLSSLAAGGEGQQQQQQQQQ